MQEKPELPWTTKYWCASPKHIFDNGTSEQREWKTGSEEAAAHCGRWANDAAYWLSGFTIAAAYLITISAIVTWKRRWDGEWGWVLLTIPALLLWHIAAPALALYLIAGTTWFVTRALRNSWDAGAKLFAVRRQTRADLRRKELLAQAAEAKRLAAENAELLPIIQELDQELRSSR